MSSGVQFVTHDGAGWLARDHKGRRYRYAPIRVGSDVFIGTRSTLMPGVEIGDRCVIGAGSIVTGSVPAGSVVAGVPARIIGSYDALEARMLRWPAQSDLGSGSYEEQVNSVVDQQMRPIVGRAS